MQFSSSEDSSNSSFQSFSMFQIFLLIAGIILSIVVGLLFQKVSSLTKQIEILKTQKQCEMNESIHQLMDQKFTEWKKTQQFYPHLFPPANPPVYAHPWTHRQTSFPVPPPSHQIHTRSPSQMKRPISPIFQSSQKVGEGVILGSTNFRNDTSVNSQPSHGVISDETHSQKSKEEKIKKENH